MSSLGTEIGLVLLILTCMRLLGGSRLLALITTVAYQGVILGVLAITVDGGIPAEHVLALAALSVIVKAGVLPYLLRNALRETMLRREIQPIVGQNMSMVLGLVFLGLSGWIGSRLPLHPGLSPHGAPVAFTMFLVGLFLVMARRQALTQALGYLVLENGIFLFGILYVHNTPWLVEVGVLLDVLAGVFIMGITIFQINRAFHAIDSDQMTGLHDLDMHCPDHRGDDL